MMKKSIKTGPVTTTEWLHEFDEYRKWNPGVLKRIIVSRVIWEFSDNPDIQEVNTHNIAERLNAVAQAAMMFSAG